MAGILDVRTYFRSRLDSLGFQEWTDGFDTDNVPSTLLERTYHISSPSISQISHNQQGLALSAPVGITLWVKGYRTPVEGYDDSFTVAESVIKDCMKFSNSKVGEYLKDVQLENVTFDPIFGDNDSIVKIVLNFICLVRLDVNS